MHTKTDALQVETVRCRGHFAYVHFAEREAALQAMQQMHNAVGSILHDNCVRNVNVWADWISVLCIVQNSRSLTPN